MLETIYQASAEKRFSHIENMIVLFLALFEKFLRIWEGCWKNVEVEKQTELEQDANVMHEETAAQ